MNLDAGFRSVGPAILNRLRLSKSIRRPPPFVCIRYSINVIYIVDDGRIVMYGAIPGRVIVSISVIQLSPPLDVTRVTFATAFLMPSYVLIQSF